MRLDQLIDRIDKCSKTEKFILVNRLAFQLNLKGDWLSKDEIIARHMYKLKQKKEWKRGK